uniref:molybdopterin molybdotransferase MoeA n=1 Tax=Castellaniella defragrans TaxID=75697 RepID=UPI00334041C8
MLDFDTAQATLAARAHTPATHTMLPLDALQGRVLAQDIVAKVDLPRADNSAMDGYALRCADFSPNTFLPVQAFQYAGYMPEALRPGQAIRLFTGSLIPEGADTVVMQENTEALDQGVRILHAPRPGDHIRRRGEDMRQGEVVLQRGTLVGPGQIAVLAAQGYATAPAYPRLRIGILTNGDELIPPGQPLGPAAVYNSNGPMLAALCRGMGADPVAVLHAPDQAGAIESALNELARTCDLILSVGGASVGDKDLVKPAVETLGGTLELWRVRMKPGKPVALASLGGRPLICLPGNPVSAFVVFTLLATPLIRGLQGRREILPPVWRGILRTDRTWSGGRDDFPRVRVEHRADALPTLSPYEQQSSGAVAGLAWTQALARIPANIETGDGATLDWYPLADWLA